MKFGKRLRETVDESLLEWRSHFIDYKEMKRMILGDVEEEDIVAGLNNDEAKVAQSHTKSKKEQQNVVRMTRKRKRDLSFDGKNKLDRDDVSDSDASLRGNVARGLNEPSEKFMETLRREVHKVNDFFLDKEEDYVIRYGFLTTEVSQALMHGLGRAETLDLKRKLIDLHGELVLLENFAHVNHVGFRKILKKHDKKTGMNIRHTYLNAVLETPFLHSDTIAKLLDGTEAQLRAFGDFTQVAPLPGAGKGGCDQSMTETGDDELTTTQYLSDLCKNSREFLMIREAADALVSSSGDIKEHSVLRSKLVRAIDKIQPNHVSLLSRAEITDAAFTEGYRCPDFSITVCTVPGSSAIQIVNREFESVFVRLIKGACSIQRYAQFIDQPASKSVLSEGDKIPLHKMPPNESDRLIGSWPTFEFNGSEYLTMHELKTFEREPALLLYVFIPALEQAPTQIEIERGLDGESCFASRAKSTCAQLLRK
mmetsp:Transcript_1261/g.2319  ORF Transcript_1261/g.2319 Transcript_1261/m.2319 type:complete len:481 (+) Transcript_1261:56-1498(+)